MYKVHFIILKYNPDLNLIFNKDFCRFFYFILKRNKINTQYWGVGNSKMKVQRENEMLTYDYIKLNSAKRANFFQKGLVECNFDLVIFYEWKDILNN